MDKVLTCRDCGTQFVFTQGEQEFYASRGFTNEPRRCPECRAARKARLAAEGESGGSTPTSGGYSSSGYDAAGYPAERPRRELHPAICSQCGKETRVPFVPRSDKPVYCSECFEQVRGPGSGRRGTGGRW